MAHDPLQPLDWNFSGCPPKEIPYLFCYEYSRELGWIIETVETIRGSHAKPEFGWYDWPEWPFRPYLSLPETERKERLKTLLARTDDPVLALRITPLIGKKDKRPGGLSVDLYMLPDAPLEEFVRMFEFYVRFYLANRELVERRKTGRAAPRAAYRDRLRALSVLRLRRHKSIAETLDLLEETYRREPFADEKALERTKRRATSYLEEFALKARPRVEYGWWFPPFGRHIITL